MALLKNIQLFKWIITIGTAESITIVSIRWIKIFQVVRRHRRQIQVEMQVQGQRIDMARMEKSILDTTCILLVFLYC